MQEEAIVQKVVNTVFGSEGVTVETVDSDELEGWYIEVRGACVYLSRSVVEVETISGPEEVEGWAIVVEDEDEGTEELDAAQNIWEALALCCEYLSDCLVNELRFAHEDEEAE